MYISNIFLQAIWPIELWTSFKAAVSVANSLYGLLCMAFRLNTIINTTESEGHFCCQGHHGESLFSNISTLYFSRKQSSIQMFIVTPEDYNACHYIKGRDIAVEFPKCCILH